MKNDKTIGIITMHRVLNYGSALQTYALQKVITQLGYQCKIIDYIYPNGSQIQKQTIFRRCKSFLSNWLKITKTAKYSSKLTIEFNDFWKKYLRFSENTYHNREELQNQPPLYDIYITGSDQVWNPRFILDDTSFLLSFVPPNKKKTAFSSSFACSKVENKAIYKELLSLYSHISVREKNGRSLIKELIDKDVPVTLDPTLLLNKEEWSIFIKPPKTFKPQISEKYILVYILTYAFDVTSNIYNIIKDVKNKMGMDVAYIGFLPNELNGIANSIECTSPEMFLTLVKNASFVITSSFHGTAFAINFGIPFYALTNAIANDDDRLISLLQILEIEDRLIPVNTDILSIKTDWNLEKLQLKLELERQKSLTYLENALSH